MKAWKCLSFNTGFSKSSVLLLVCSTLILISPNPGRAALMPRLVQDISTNTESSLVGTRPFAVIGGVAYFQAIDPEHGAELWRSDGTEAGTSMVIDLIPGVTGSSPQYITAWGNNLFFGA